MSSNQLKIIVVSWLDFVSDYLPQSWRPWIERLTKKIAGVRTATLGGTATIPVSHTGTGNQIPIETGRSPAISRCQSFWLTVGGKVRRFVFVPLPQDQMPEEDICALLRSQGFEPARGEDLEAIVRHHRHECPDGRMIAIGSVERGEVVVFWKGKRASDGRLVVNPFYFPHGERERGDFVLAVAA